MAAELTSIDFGSSSMKFAIGKAGKNKIKIKRMFSVPMPEDAVINGEIKDWDALLDALRTTVKAKRLSGKKTVATLQSNQFISREFIIPKLKKETEVLSALRFEVEQFMPIAFDEFVMCSRVLSEQNDEHGKATVRYIVGLMPQKIVDSFYQLLKHAGLNPVAMDVNFNALEKFLDFSGFGKEVVLAADIGCNSIDMTVFENGLPMVNRTIPIGGSEITRSIAQTFSMEPSEAEAKKTLFADLQIGEAITREDEDLSNVARMVVSDWVEQLRRMTEFYMSRTKGKTIDSIYIYGGSSALKGLTQHLGGSFEMNVRALEFPHDIKVKASSNAPEYAFINAVGAIIRR